ncbi:hypothetical protein [Candidatus Tisiphia endosymbiont of Nemotelus uliginosus]|uniref:hypothetical protein n=1 Tax=Candidatus Tisiphia endosymbiont of Nemotelus uliginosus TaxID=3077926 RepID=UPI0035C8E778
MSQNHPFPRVLLLFLGVLFFACTTHINAHIIPRVLSSKGVTSTILAKFELNEMLGYIIAGLGITTLINKIKYRSLAISSLIIIIIGMTNMMLVQDYTILKFHGIIISIAYYTYVTITIIHILEESENKHLALIIFSLLWIAGYFLVYLLRPFLTTHINALLICVTFYMLIIITCLPKSNIIHKTHMISKFSFLMENIELQILTGFMVTYIVFAILWYYEGFAKLNQFPISNIWSIIYYIFLTILLFIAPIILTFKFINKYLMNFILISILIASFILLPSYGTNLVWNIILLSLIGLCLWSIFLGNILILSDKFSNQDYRIVLMIYFTMCALGMYSGALSSYISYDPTNPQNFLFSIFTASTIFILYYAWCLFTQKLYRG